MSDVDINAIRPSGNDTIEVVNRVGPDGPIRSPRREADRYRNVGRTWRSDLRETGKALSRPIQADVEGRMREARRLSRPERTGVR